jgi:hypothetical protein
MRATLVCVVVLAACGSDGKHEVVPEGFQTLLSGEWTLPPGSEGYYCVRATAPEDMYISSFRPIAPLGTHHTALALDLQGGEDGTFPCQASDTGFKLLFGSGVGTDAFALPDGVAFKLPEGQQVLLNLHLYNASDNQLTGTSGVEIERIKSTDVVHEAETIYALNFNVEVPPGSSVTSGACTMDEASTIFGVFPHMHRLGTNMKATAMHAAGAEVFHDHPYTFESQLDYLVGPIDVAKGEKIAYECAYDNPGTQTVKFGDSTDAEMCVLGLYRYPASGAISLCIN